MKKAIILSAVATAVFAIPTAAHADQSVASADCNSITVTAPADARVIWSIDNEPPSGLEAGQSATQAFPPSASSHSYVVFINPGPDVTYVDGTVTDCPFNEPTAEQLAPAAIPGPTPVVEADAVAEPVAVVALAEPVAPEPTVVTPWESVTLAPPW